METTHEIVRLHNLKIMRDLTSAVLTTVYDEIFNKPIADEKNTH